MIRPAQTADPLADTIWWRVGLLALTAWRLMVAARMPLSADEAYYWVWSHGLQPGYLDHPPMVALWIAAGRAVAGETALGVRLAGPFSALVGTLLLARAAEDLAPGRRAGVMAGLLFNATLSCNAGAVVMTPDTPLVFFWTAALAGLARLRRSDEPRWWLAVGAACGLALDSKYTAILLGISIVAWLVCLPEGRRWWRAWQLWAGGFLALALFYPVLHWNAVHGFASFAKQGGRTGDWHPGDAPRYLIELVAGQIGLATPLVAVLFGAGMVRAAQGAWRKDQVAGLLAWVTLLPAMVFLEHALGGRVQANWPAVLFPGAALAAACVGVPVRGWRVAGWSGLSISAAICIQAAWAPLALPRSVDFTLVRLAGWQDLAGRVFVAERQAGADFVVADSYGLASELAFRLPGAVIAREPRWKMFSLPAPSLGGRTGILVRSLREAGEPDAHGWASVSRMGEITRGQGGRVAETYRIYRVVAAAASDRAAWADTAIVQLPHGLAGRD